MTSTQKVHVSLTSPESSNRLTPAHSKVPQADTGPRLQQDEAAALQQYIIEKEKRIFAECRRELAVIQMYQHGGQN